MINLQMLFFFVSSVPHTNLTHTEIPNRKYFDELVNKKRERKTNKTMHKKVITQQSVVNLQVL